MKNYKNFEIIAGKKKKNLQRNNHQLEQVRWCFSHGLQFMIKLNWTWSIGWQFFCQTIKLLSIYWEKVEKFISNKILLKYLIHIYSNIQPWLSTVSSFQNFELSRHVRWKKTKQCGWPIAQLVSSQNHD